MFTDMLVKYHVLGLKFVFTVDNIKTIWGIIIMPNKTITVENVDIDLLRDQRGTLLQIRKTYLQPSLTTERLSGLIHFLDACIDAADKE